MSRYKLCIADWNGTLQDDLHHIYECGVQRIFRHFGLRCPTMDEYRNEVTADFMQFYWAHGIPRDVTAKDLNAIMAEGFKEKGAPPGVFPDALAAVQDVRAYGCEVTLVSGYDGAKLKAAVERNGFAPCFTAVLGDVRDKAAVFSALMAERGLKPADVFIVGDTVEDAQAAAAIGASAYICTRGFHTRERIQELCGGQPLLTLIQTLGELLPRLPC